MAEFPLLPIPTPEPDRRPPGSGGGGRLQLPDRTRQGHRLGPVFQRLRAVFDEERDPLTLCEDPAGIAPERALVLEVAGMIDKFHEAVRRVPGLELLGDEETEFEPDTDFAIRDTRKGRDGEPRLDKPVGGRLYVAMPDTQALRELVSLWDRYQAGHPADTGFAPWHEVFRQLHQLRAWGPSDRIPEETIDSFNEQLADRPDATVRVEIELWSHQSRENQRRANARLEAAVRDSGGELVRRCSIPEIAYEAALVDLPAAEVRRLIERQETLLAICDGTTIKVNRDNELRVLFQTGAVSRYIPRKVTSGRGARSGGIRNPVVRIPYARSRSPVHPSTVWRGCVRQLRKPRSGSAEVRRLIERQETLLR